MMAAARRTPAGSTAVACDESQAPFEVLRDANEQVIQSLRRDEASPDLERQLTLTGMSASARAYFCDPYINGSLGSQIRPKSFMPLPDLLVRERESQESVSSSMGLLQEIDHAWMSVGSVLHLWNFRTQEVVQFRELEQVIETVALVAPRRGVFAGAVKHVLLVGTAKEVVVLAITHREGFSSGGNRRIEVRRTSFAASTKGVTLTKIAGHANGRAFMAGKDGNLYELAYSVEESPAFSCLGFGNPVTRKCKRRAHRRLGGRNSLRAALTLFGYHDSARVLVDVVVDSLRNVLYTLHRDGTLDLYDLGVSGNQTTLKVENFDLRKAAANFCRWDTSLLLPPGSFFAGSRNKFQVVSLGLVDPSEAKGISLVAVSNHGMRFYLSCSKSGDVRDRNNFRLAIVQIRCPPPETLMRYLRQRRGPVGGETEDGGQLVTQPQDGFAAKWGRQGSESEANGEAEGEGEWGGEGSGGLVYKAYCCQGVLVMAQAVENRDRLILVGPDLVTRSKRRREMHQEEHPWAREAVDSMSCVAAHDNVFMSRVWAIGERSVFIAMDPEGARCRKLVMTSMTPSEAQFKRAADWGDGGIGNGGGSEDSGHAIGGRVHYPSATTPNKRQRQLQFPERPIAPGPPTVISPGGSAGFCGGLLPNDVERMVALSELGTQSYSERREILCLTSAGLQVLSKLRPVDVLYDHLAQNDTEKVSRFFHDSSQDQSITTCFSIACVPLTTRLAGSTASGCISRIVIACQLRPARSCPRCCRLLLQASVLDGAGRGHARPELVSQFFRHYSLEQSAAMCFSIACGLPRDLGRGVDGWWMRLPYSIVVPLEVVRGRALDAAVSCCGPPSLTVPHEAPGYEKFATSSLYNGLQLFVSRLLRPFWLQPVVTARCQRQPVEGGSGLKRSADGQPRKGPFTGENVGTRVAPEVLDLEALLEPLAWLRESIRAVFPHAVSEDLAKAAGEKEEAEEEEAGGETLWGQHERAMKIEVLRVHTTYRLVSRAAVVARLLGVLRRAARERIHAQAGGEGIPWSTLDGVPLWRLVTGKEEHYRLSVLLTDLVVDGAARREQLPTAAGKKIGYAEALGTSSCGAFFGRGYLQTLEGLELLSVSVDLSGARREESMGHGAALLTEAARYWRGERALGASGQLSRACEALSRAEMLEALVDVCVTCARNFQGSEPPKPPKPLKPPEPSSGLDGTGGVSMTGEGSNRPSNITQAPIGGRVAEWETVIYDGKGLVDAGKIEEARLECYQRAVDAVIGVLELPMVATRAEEEEVAAVERAQRFKLESVMERCLSHDAPQLHEMVFNALEAKDKSILLSFRTPLVEQYLSKDPALLFRYLLIHEDYPKAVFVMDMEAQADPRQGVGVRHRLECLVKAISVCHKCDLESGPTVGSYYTINHRKLQNLEDLRGVLMAQERLLADLRDSVKPLERCKAEGRGTEHLNEVLRQRGKMEEEWEATIMDPEKLFAQASEAFLWEGCLRLMMCCNVNEPVLVRKLFRSIIWRQVPRFSREGYEPRARTFQANWPAYPAGEIFVDHTTEELKKDGIAKHRGDDKGIVAFEDDNWFRPLLHKMGELSRELLTGRGRFTLPVDSLCLELQAIADAFHEAGGSVTPLDVVKTLRNSGVRATSLLRAYDRMVKTRRPGGNAMRLRWLEVTVQCLTWIGEGNQPGEIGGLVMPDRLEGRIRVALEDLESLGSPDNGKQGQLDRAKLDAQKRELERLSQSLWMSLRMPAPGISFLRRRTR